MNRKSFIVGIAFLALAAPIAQARVRLPDISSYDGTNEILEHYVPYLAFVLRIGKTHDQQTANNMVTIFSKLKKRNPELAARFLKNLRYELIQKQELMTSAQGLHSDSKETREWIEKYLPIWADELDELRFRSIAKKAE